MCRSSNSSNRVIDLITVLNCCSLISFYTQKKLHICSLLNQFPRPTSSMRTDHQLLNDKCNKVGTYAQLFETSRAQSVNTLSPSGHPTSISIFISPRTTIVMKPLSTHPFLILQHPDVILICVPSKRDALDNKKKKAAIYLGPSNQIVNLQKEMVISAGCTWRLGWLYVNS